MPIEGFWEHVMFDLPRARPEPDGRATPGPWRPLKLKIATRVFWIVVCKEGRLPETEANARLKAAAPDMLGVLQTLQRVVKSGYVKSPDAAVLTIINDVIEQATGRPGREGRR
jgi:hypothetical protein